MQSVTRDVHAPSLHCSHVILPIKHREKTSLPEDADVGGPGCVDRVNALEFQVTPGFSGAGK